MPMLRKLNMSRMDIFITFVTLHSIYPICSLHAILHIIQVLVCVEVLRPSQPNGVMLSMVSLPNHTFTGQA